jgi:ferredoxin
MGNYKIIYDKKNCIGAGECGQLSPDFWSVKNDGKAELKGAMQNPKTGLFELVIDDSKLKKQKDVANGCPGGCIKIQ